MDSKSRVTESQKNFADIAIDSHKWRFNVFELLAKELHLGYPV